MDDLLTFPLTLPPGAPSEVAWTLLSVTAESVSPFTLASQIYEWPGQKLGAVVTMPPMKRDAALLWQAFFASLRGRAGTFWFGDSRFACKQDVGLGLPETVGISQGRDVASTGWTPLAQSVVKPGDWLRIGAALRKVLTAADADADGNAAFMVWPDLQAVPAETEIIWQDPKGIFRLSQDPPELVWTTAQIQASFTFSIIEA